MKYEPVHFHIYDPSGQQLFKSAKNDKARCFVVNCSMPNDCELRDLGMCSMVGGIGTHRCPYGKLEITDGYTKRARKFREWVNDKKEKYKEVPNLKSHNKGIYKIGEFFFLPFAHIEMNESVPFLAKSGFMMTGNAFVKSDHFNKETVKSIIMFRPQALMGGEIKSYQRETVPLFLKHLSEKHTGMFNELCKDIPKIKEILGDFSNVGRLVIAATLKVGCTISKRDESWSWDGEWFNSKTHKPIFGIVDHEEFESRFKPKSKATFKIQSDDQVCEDTIFVS